jgi:hypothetical protein
MMKKLIALALFLSSFSLYAQNDFEEWDKNYKEIDLNEIIRQEKLYADTVEKATPEGDSYARMDRYRFPAEFTGEKRELTNIRRSIMKATYKLFGVKDNLNHFDLIKSEYQFNIDGEIYWFAIQPQLEEPFNAEIEKGSIAYLYCLYLNMHTTKNELYNLFLLSEFHALVEEE